MVPEDAIAENILKPKIYLTESTKAGSKKRLVSDGIDGNKPLIMIGILGSAPKTNHYLTKTMAQLIDATIAEPMVNWSLTSFRAKKEEVLQIIN